MSSKSMIVAALAALISFASLAHAQAGPYKIVKIQLIGGEGGSDYINADPDGRNLYVARSGPADHGNIQRYTQYTPTSNLTITYRWIPRGSK